MNSSALESRDLGLEITTLFNTLVSPNFGTSSDAVEFHQIYAHRLSEISPNG